MMPVYTWDEIHTAPRGSYVGISHPDGRHVLTDDLDDPIVRVQRRINKVKSEYPGDWPGRVKPADLARIAAWLDTHPPEAS